MKISLAGLTVLTMAALTGCFQGTPGGPGTTGNAGKANKAPAYVQSDETFNLSVPVLSSSLQQGASIEAVVGIQRAKNFGEDVALSFADLPQGVTVEPANAMIKHGDTDAKITFKAGDEAPLGEFKVKVTGHPTKGSDAEVEFKLGVAAKDSFTLGVPLLPIALNQGETKTVLLGVSRQKTFDQEVTLKFGELPKGVTIAPAAPVIKQDETSVEIAYTAATDAALGKFTIQVTGRPAKGADVLSEFTLTVAKE